MADDDGVSRSESSDVIVPTRWTCEACGCNTNTEESDSLSCGVCGTRRAPSILRRGGARLGLRGFNNDEDDDEDDEDDDDEEDEDERERNRGVMNSENRTGDDSDAAVLFMAGVADNAISFRGGQGGVGARRLLRVGSRSSTLNPIDGLQAAQRSETRSVFGSSPSSTNVDSEELLSLANENAKSYDPKWSIKFKGSSIIVNKENQNVASLHEGSDEGRSVRADIALPTSQPALSFDGRQSPSNNSSNAIINAIAQRRSERERRVYGWKIVFEHSSRDVGKSMGGCYLVGVTTHAFSSFSVRNGLQQSRQFWGIEDGGRKFGGSASRSRQGAGSSSQGVRLGRNEVSRNADGVLFGSRDIITIVADLDARTLNFWRGARFLGALITGLPQSSAIYPVAVPFNVGVSVAITGMDGDPLVALSDFHAARRLSCEASNEEQRKILSKQKEMLIHDGKLSNRLLYVLRTIFSWYAGTSISDSPKDVSSSSTSNLSKITLAYTSASRLWLRSGLSIGTLHAILKEAKTCSDKSKEGKDETTWRMNKVTFDDYVTLLSNLVHEENKRSTSQTGAQERPGDFKLHLSTPIHEPIILFEEGDKVEVAEGYEKYGDASSGPLRPGDRGTVMEVQRGPQGDRQSVRVLFNGRRWWYQPNALLSERSGLVQSPSVRLLSKLLRVHGFDSNLKPLWGKKVTVELCMPGDLVVSTSNGKTEKLLSKKKFGVSSNSTPLLGRIISHHALQNKESPLVTVDFADDKDGFKKVDASSLIFTTFYHGISVSQSSQGTINFMKKANIQKKLPEKTSLTLSNNDQDDDIDNIRKNSKQTEHLDSPLLKSIKGVKKLDKRCIMELMKECKSQASLARMFAFGLHEAIFEALNEIRKRTYDEISLSSLGYFIILAVKILFNKTLEEDFSFFAPTSYESTKPTDADASSEGNNTLESSRRTPSDFRTIANTVNMREFIRDLGVGPEQRRGVLLALMASARMNDETRFVSETMSSDERHARGGNHLLSSFSRLSAEAAAFGMSSSLNHLRNDEENSVVANTMQSEVTSRHPESLLQTVMRGRNHFMNLSTSNSTSRRSSSSSTNSLIHNGLLMNNAAWVKKHLKAGADLSTSRNGDVSILQLAVSLGCSNSIIHSLIKGGAVVKEKELLEAAWSNQPSALSLLLEHSIYTEGSINLKNCSIEVVDAFSTAKKKQKLEEDKMREMGLSFVKELIQKYIALALQFRLEKKKTQFSAVMDTLVGDILLHRAHVSQLEGLPSNTLDESGLKNGKDKISSMSSSIISSINPLFTRNSSINSQRGQCGKTHKYVLSSVLNSIPASVLENSLKEENSTEKSSALTSYLRLIDIHLWSKDKKEIAVGLTLACILHQKIPSLCGQIGRYGIKDLAASHLTLADDALSDIKNMLLENKDVGSTDCEQQSVNFSVVKCPKGHTTILHLTRHSQFKCDLCGKGVEQNKPMHGCRECDWDACETCTDKAEGGLVKWTCIRDLAIECKNIFNDLQPNEVSVSSDISSICQNIRNKKICGIHEMITMMKRPGKITLHEFATFILPALYETLIKDNQQNSSSYEICGKHQTRRRSKKPRVGKGSMSLKRSFQLKKQAGRPFVKDRFGCENKCFSNAAASALLQSLETESKTSEVESLNDKECDVHDAMSIDVRDSEGGEDEIFIDSNLENDDNSNVSLKGEESLESFVDESNIPTIIQYLHAVLAFHERVVVINCSRKKGNESDDIVGELQSLLYPFEIELRRSLHNDARGSCSDLKGGVIHVEPLMRLEELQFHILRCAKINIPSYVFFCRRLVDERAIIAERSIRKDNSSNVYNNVHRVAQVLEYYEETGVHRIRYSSNIEISINGEVDTLFDFKSIVDDLQFNGDEVSLVLATRDYCILCRNRCSSHDGDFNMEGGCTGTDIPQNADGQDSIMHPSRTLSLENNSEHSISVETLALPVGTRVEVDFESSDISKPGIYSVMSIYFEKNSCASKDLLHGSILGENDIISSLRYNLISDTGEVLFGVGCTNIKGYESLLNHISSSDLSQNDNTLRRQSRDQMMHSSRTNQSVFQRGISASRRSHSGNAETSEHTDRVALRQQQPSTNSAGVLKRSWSALSPVEKMNPLDLTDNDFQENGCISDRYNSGSTLKLHVGDNEVEVNVDLRIIEKPPVLSVEFSMSERAQTTTFRQMNEMTLFSCLQQLRKEKRLRPKTNIFVDRKCVLYYSLSIDEEVGTDMNWNSSLASRQDSVLPQKFTPPWVKSKHENEHVESILSRPSEVMLNHFQLQYNNFYDCDNDASISCGLYSQFGWNGRESNGFPSFTDCDGIDETCAQSLEILSFLANKAFLIKNSNAESKEGEAVLSKLFVSEAMTKKLMHQLEDPLMVVGGALPDWCITAPILAPRVFSHSSRRRLLEFAAFGVSRSTLRQQEAKVAVEPLRQKMAALRGRAVELVGEAFSGGAADPTALQLQADELYGMEDALGNRINAAFRAQRWDECSLQCVKGVVRRDNLLKDAARIMENYCSNARVNRRRLEIRFERESGFDAASGDEAGVTRGFYADVADALMSCDHVAGVFSSSLKCEHGFNTNSMKSHHAVTTNDIETRAFDLRKNIKLPIWIPDVDSTGQVIIPTPRADPGSSLGLFPRPMSPSHVLHSAVLEHFRFIGRLFAAALRDGFLFPLPLSPSFLKLVQSFANGVDLASLQEQSLYVNAENCLRRRPSSSSMSSINHPSNNSNSSSPSSSPVPKTNVSSDDYFGLDSSTGGKINLESSNSCLSFFSPDFDSMQAFPTFTEGIKYQLNSHDLPRPGFLGGEIYAVESFICAKLDLLDEMEPMLSNEDLAQKRKAIATDKSFARNALGKLYDCSFEEYFMDRTFVDPLDPSQGNDAAPLCKDGASISVTIDNVREWVYLAKRYFLFDGIIFQASAFKQGIEDFFSCNALLLFTPDELYKDICGGGDNVDNWDENCIRSLFKLDGGKGAAEALVAVAAMGGEGGAALSRRFGPSSPTIGFLVKTLVEATTIERRQFLSFVTSVPIVTPGLIEVVPVVNPAGEFLPMCDPSCLPRANTCARRLYLPKFENYESFSQVFWSVVREECRFKGFFEWRG